MTASTAYPQHIAALSCGRDHSLALLAHGKVFGWGGDGSGRIPPGSPEYCSTSKAPTRAVEVNLLHRLTAVAAGYGISLGITAHRRIAAWGANAAELGTPDTTIELATPKLLAGINNARAVVAEPVTQLRYPNSTNLHLHGIHVTPGLVAPNVYGDYVLDDPALGIQPGATRQYEYFINAAQPPGAYWYHPHLHGASALQIGSGMAGALIIESTGDGINQVPEIAAAQQREFMFQAPITNAGGVLESFTQIANTTTNEGPFLVNGMFQPTIEMQRGEVQNWHFINAGIFNFLNLVLEGHTLNVYSLDGNPRSGMVAVNDSGPTGIVLAPGNRASVLVQAAMTAGTYHLKKLNLVVGGSASSPQNLATIVVKDPPLPMALPSGPLPVPASLAPITDQEFAAAGGLKRKFVLRILMGESVPPNPPDWIYQTDSTNFADKIFTMGASGALSSASPPVPTDPAFQFRPFQSPTALKQTAALNSVEEWTVFNMNNIQHPFHIHINPMFITKINGVAVPEPYWVDTIALPRGGTPANPTSITFRTRFSDFTGSFVMHCHMLAHEDTGMMQVVEVV